MASILIVQGVHRIAEPLFKMTLSFPFWAKIPAGFFFGPGKKDWDAARKVEESKILPEMLRFEILICPKT